MEKRVSFPISADEHKQLKVLAAKEGKSIKDLFLEALEKAFPNWRKNK